MVVVDDDVTSTTITTSVSTTTTTTATTTTPTATAVKINIKCKTEMDRKLLVAAIEGDIEYLDSIRRSKTLRTTVCSSGCTLLHWAAGSNQVNNVNIIVEYKKSYGRTPLHYACRNGSLEAVQYLCLSPYCHAIPDIKAKQGVTPFQLAIWQNHLQVCQFLTTSTVGIVPSIDFNDFGCGAIHWIGIAPKHRANFTTTTTTTNENNNEYEDENNNNENDNGHDLLPLIKWLSKQDGINFFIKQRQGHTALHKAVWGGHMSIVKYLREEIGMFDDQQDDAGNFAASLADMANTTRHTKIGVYLRQHCSRKRYNSLQILGLTASMSTKSTMSESTLALGKNEIRKAYLKKARQLHPDR
ncbi:ankyrin, partial [Fragilariopsis cylindrus CCMP1102]